MALVLLTDVKAHLNVPDATTTYDAELQGFIDAATVVVEDIAGDVVQRTLVGEQQDGGSPFIALRHTPVVSITSVVEYVGTSAFTLTSQPLGATVNNYGYELIDANGGILLRRGAAGVPLPFQGDESSIVVSYVAGYATTPPNVRMGALELIRHWWQQSQQGGRPSFSSAAGGDAGLQVGSYLVPYFVAELLASTPTSPRRVPGIA